MAISTGNSKVGKIPNMSLPPVVSCGNCEKCKKNCYALKSFKMYPSVRKSWTENFKLAKENPVEFFAVVDAYIEKKKPAFFRWQVSGDILDQNYLDGMVEVARAHKATKFLAFTKMYHLDYANIPENLSIVWSAWPGLEMPTAPEGIRIAYMQDGTETRVPKNALECPGNCESCGLCWTLKKIRRDVVFYKH
jgi:ferredoxin